ncbi:hypothetical protein MPTK1_2g26170 [Marchantia polymorpha subsp. ruderalis]|uniref:Protein kinase domain-containing protein n=1 Tax=Marchantia polymorpha TaxID=3197 RepID=A0A2R6XB94_MARPO|nr:hypothetical protein MARPO_0025s0065 [Marchantia polymorpha]BBN03759.1 hypothetical protein Mp_2g26170 [Marchantia polymorpha subsp. ruderalis]|eukprot:PTQ43374.1 hypothetical protein MARPO_0025s0065 [Marchantia polymorpha]
MATESLLDTSTSKALLVKKAHDMNSGLLLLVVSTLLLCSAARMQAALVPEEESALESIRTSFNQPKWTGDPCSNAQWITCSGLSQPDNVWKLNLEKQNLTGTIPADITKFRQVRELILAGNRLDGQIPDFSNMTSLQNLDLSDNNLSGRIPDTSVLTNLTRIALNRNQLSGGIPASIFNHTKLEILLLQDNPLGGPIPELDNLNSLQILDLTNIQANGTVPLSIEKIEKATEIYLGHNPQLSGTLPAMSNLIHLKFFNAGFCALSGNIPDLKNTGGLETLDLQMNDFSGDFPTALLRHESLRLLYLNNNPRLSGSIPDTSMLKSLQEMYTNDCNLTGELNSPALRKSIILQKVGLWNNRLETFPLDLVNLTQLVQIDVHNNTMTGNLPDLPAGVDQITNGVYLKSLNFSNNHFSGGLPSSWYQLSYLEEMVLDSNNLSGVIDPAIGTLTSLKELRIRNNNFSGPMAEEVGLLQNLQILDLRNNQFSGNVPRSLANLPNLHTLLLDNNRFTGIPDVLLNKSRLLISYTNNDNIRIIYATSATGLSTGAKIGIVIGVLAASVIIAVSATILYNRRHKKFDAGQLSAHDMPEAAKSFSLKEIKAITQNHKRVIGKGGFGPVYFGKLVDGKEVAVKVRATDSKQGAEEFLNEVRLLSRLHHRNLVSLVGYCLESHQQILLYDYMSKGTLYDHLYQSSESDISNPDNPSSSTNEMSLHEPLTWKTRLDIAINAARGLEYLHKDCNPPVIHRDVKSSNILLTEKLLAKVGDLGISKQADEQHSRETLNDSGVSTVIKGTFGYLDPEYFTRNRLTTKSDVYSFGMVLLEIITAKKPQTQKFVHSSAKNIIDWVQGALSSDQLESVVDPNLFNEYDRESMIMVVETALLCLRPKGTKRPEMGDVVRVLTKALQMDLGYVDSSSTTDSHRRVSKTADLIAPLTSSSIVSSSSRSFSLQSLPSWDTDAR